MASVQVEYGSKLTTVRLVDNTLVNRYGPAIVNGVENLVIKPYQTLRYTLNGSPQRTRTAQGSTIYVSVPSGGAIVYRVS
jgi:hypothetical protein